MKLIHHKSQLPAPAKDELDRLLDSALAQYKRIEPRPGLEDRILANLRAARMQLPSRAWWREGLATAVAAIAFVFLSLMFRHLKPSPVITVHVPANVQVPVAPRKAPLSDEVTAVAQPAHRALRQSVAHAEKRVVATHPKLDHFPSPQPLTTEEIALAQYVKNFPKEARLVAQAQEEFEFEAQKEMNDGSETRLSDSTQHER